MCSSAGRWVAEFTGYLCLADPTANIVKTIPSQQVAKVAARVREALHFIVALLAYASGRTTGDAGFAAAVRVEEAV